MFPPWRAQLALRLYALMFSRKKEEKRIPPQTTPISHLAVFGGNMQKFAQ